MPGSAQHRDVVFGHRTEGGGEIFRQFFPRVEGSLFSVCTIGSAEITRNGGDRCICRVIRVLPDVAGTAIFRNDIIIRGGASNEDRFYLDGIEMPAIDHFNT